MTAKKKGKKETQSPSNSEIVTLTRAGRDLHNKDKTLDAHVRVESYKQIGTAIYVDQFDSRIADASEAHILSESFPYNDSGAKEATEFLQENGFRVAVMIK